MSSPFHIFSWQQPFLPALKQATDLWSDGRPGDAVIIVPHNRPWRYLVDIYAAAGTTGLLPKVLSLPDMVRLWRMHASPVPLRTACLLDRVALLRDCVLGLADEDHELEKRFGKLSPDAFLPWGIRLANLLEELLGQNMVTDDLPFIDEVSPPAAALLGALPLMIGWGMGAELRRPLGVTMVGGLIVSQVLTLFTTPVIYIWFARLAEKLGRRGGEAGHEQA